MRGCSSPRRTTSPPMSGGWQARSGCVENGQNPMTGYQSILRALQSHATEPGLSDTALLYIDLISAQASVQVGDGEIVLEPERAAAGLREGLPLLSPEMLNVDGPSAANLCHEICSITALHRPELAPQLFAIDAWLGERQADLPGLAGTYLRDEAKVRREGEEAGLDGPLLAFVLNQALRPFLRKLAQGLVRSVDEAMWYRPMCPICGGRPDFSALAKSTGGRRLLCSRCDTEWAFWRGTCPFCEGDGSDTLEYSVSDDQVYRLYTCKRCRGYLKTIDLRQVEGERLLTVERILTMGMDLAAREAGYALTA